MPPITLAADRLRLTVLPHLGAGIADFSLLGPAKYHYPLMRRAAPDETNPSALASFFMAPWCNRTAGARFRFGGVDHTLRANTPDGNAQHGDVRARPWTILDRSPTTARLGFDSRDVTPVPLVPTSAVNYPFPFACTARYELSPQALEIELSVRNVGESPMPAGCGHHPYFSRRLWAGGGCDDDVRLRAAVGGRYPTKGSIPTGPAVADDLTRSLRTTSPLPAAPLDDVFAGFDGPGGGAELHWPASGVTLHIQASANLGHLVLFAPHAPPTDAGAAGGKATPLPYIAVEPQSQVNNALNIETPDSGTVVLAPGDSLVTLVQFIVRPG